MHKEAYVSLGIARYYVLAIVISCVCLLTIVPAFAQNLQPLRANLWTSEITNSGCDYLFINSNYQRSLTNSEGRLRGIQAICRIHNTGWRSCWISGQQPGHFTGSATGEVLPGEDRLLGTHYLSVEKCPTIDQDTSNNQVVP